jgi:hypothetical protein
VLATGRFGTADRECRAMLGYGRRELPRRRWSVDGTQGWRRFWFPEPVMCGACALVGVSSLLRGVRCSVPARDRAKPGNLGSCV